MSDDGFIHLPFSLEKPKTLKGHWKILVADDDKFIHQVTQLVLKSLVIENKSIELYPAYSAEQAKQIFSEHQDIALAFIDIVMETDDAGLELVKWIREVLNNHSTRIILRTGQTGQMPADFIVKNYDINDFKDKTELTANKLTSTTYTAIRSYRDIINVENSVLKLNQLVQSAASFGTPQAISKFANQTIKQLLELLKIDGHICHVVKLNPSIITEQVNIELLGQTGQYQSLKGFNHIPPLSYALISRCFAVQKSIEQDEYQLIFIKATNYSDTVILLKTDAPLNSHQISCLKLYAANMACNYETVSFQQQIETSQIELINALSDAIEARDVAPSNHGKTVASYSKKLAKLAGCDNKVCIAIEHAAPLHDIGKVIIPEHILNKPASLDEQEWEIIKSHTVSGAKLLSQSKLPITQTAAKIALSHHENWDGSGYPEGLKGSDIPLEARIVSLADVLAVLAEASCYRSAWSSEKIKSYINEQSGIKFDPKLAKLVIANFADFSLPDKH